MHPCSALLRSMTAVIGTIAVVAALNVPVATAQAQKVLKFIPQADLRILDPITTTAYITRNHGYMIYDTLFATDAKFQVQPQMVDKYELSERQADLHVHAARRTQVPRRPAGALGRLHRVDRALGEARRARPEAGGSRPNRGRPSTTRRSRSSSRSRFRSRSRRSAKPSSNVPFIMPERIAKTDASTNITEAIGSGPFKFVKEEWVPGSKVVYVKNTDYVPRKEPPSWAAGGKVVEGRPRRVDLHPGLGDRRGGAQRRRGRLVGADAARPDPGAGARTRTSRSRTSIRSARWA